MLEWTPLSFAQRRLPTFYHGLDLQDRATRRYKISRPANAHGQAVLAHVTRPVTVERKEVRPGRTLPVSLPQPQ